MKKRNKKGEAKRKLAPNNWWAVAAKQRTTAGAMPNRKKAESKRKCRGRVKNGK